MNLSKIFKMQETLDQSIMETHQVKAEEVRTKRIVALLVEIGEFANEYAPFKYWKKSKQIKHFAVLEEFVDGIHFLTSLANELKLDSEIKEIVIAEDQSIQLAHTFKAISNLLDNFNAKTLLNAYGLYLGNAKLLKISEQEILTHYIAKNKVNFQRIKENY